MFETYADSATSPIVTNITSGKVSIPAAWRDFVNMAAFHRESYFSSPEVNRSAGWLKGMDADSINFGFLMPLSDVNNILRLTTSCPGDWGAVPAPVPSHRGGAYIAAAKGTDNAILAAEIIRCLTTNSDVAYDMTVNDYINGNSITAMMRLASSEDGEMNVLGGQNPYGYFLDVGEKLYLNVTPYDYDLGLHFVNYTADFANDEATYDECLGNFYRYAEQEYALSN
jgi:hypothetical protein